MEEILSKKLKQGTYTIIDQDFKDRSKRFILASSQNKRFSIKDYIENHKLSLSISFAAMLIVMGSFEGISYLKNNTSQLASRSKTEDISTESEKLNIDIQLKELQYFNDSNNEVATLLREVRNFESTQ